MLACLLLLTQFVTNQAATSYYISTVAGSAGAGGPTTFGSSAANTKLENPAGVFVSSTNNIYIADGSSTYVKKFPLYGIITAFAGTGTASATGTISISGAATSAKLIQPVGVHGSSTGLIYIADLIARRIRVVSTSGIISEFSGNGGISSDGDNGAASYAGINNPNHVFADSAGNVFIADGLYKIRKVSNGIITTIAGTGVSGGSGDTWKATSATINTCYSIFVDTVGIVYLAFSNKLRKVDSSNIIKTFAGSGSSSNANSNIAATSADISSGRGVWGDSVGNIYYVDNGSLFRMIRLITASTNIVSSIAGNGGSGQAGDGGYATSATLTTPYGLTGSSTGSIYFTDTSVFTVRALTTVVPPSMQPSISPTQFPTVLPSYSMKPTISPSQAPTYSPVVAPQYYSLSAFAGAGTSGDTGDGGQAVAASFSNIYALFQDSVANTFIVDTAASRVRKVNGNGIISAFLGHGDPQSDGDGGQASSANVLTPTAIWGNTAGKVFVLDQICYIRMIDINGIVTAYAGDGQGTGSYAGDDGPASVASWDYYTQALGGDSVGNIFIGDTTRIRKINSLLIISTIAGGSAGLSTADNQAATSTGFLCTLGLFVDFARNIYFMDSSFSDVIRKLSYTTNIITTIAGKSANYGYNGDGFAASSAYVSNPTGLWIDTLGKIFFADQSNARIRMISTSSIIYTIAGNNFVGSSTIGVATSSSLRLPTGICGDSLGSLYISTEDYYVRKLSLIVSSAPTISPTVMPTTLKPTVVPTILPTIMPTVVPTPAPSVLPSIIPSQIPSVTPTVSPTISPTCTPTVQPTIVPTVVPTISPSITPSVQPSISPSVVPTISPSIVPSIGPSYAPTVVPSVGPTVIPTIVPSIAPSVVPTVCPSFLPSVAPSTLPTVMPTVAPSFAPTIVPTTIPSVVPSSVPTVKPSASPTGVPSVAPTYQPTTTSPSIIPTINPSVVPTLSPTAKPTVIPSLAPTDMPVLYSVFPTIGPSLAPSFSPTISPSSPPSVFPTIAPSVIPTGHPTVEPSVTPTVTPTLIPTDHPTALPSVVPSLAPSCLPSVTPSAGPSIVPSMQPTEIPSMSPSLAPSLFPTALPIIHPSLVPTLSPTDAPSELPSVLPTVIPSSAPTVVPTATPTLVPSVVPSVLPSCLPSTSPSTNPSIHPSVQPTTPPTYSPTLSPTSGPSVPPSLQPSVSPTLIPSVGPSHSPTQRPSMYPSVKPSVVPSESPSVVPSIIPSEAPSVVPTTMPTVLPSTAPTGMPSWYPTITVATLPSDDPISVIGTQSFKIVIPTIPSISFDSSNSAFRDVILVSGSSGVAYGVLSGTRNEIANSHYGYTKFLSADSAKRSVSILKNVNGDGNDGIIVGDPINSRCYVLYGTANGLTNMTQGFTIFGESETDLTGWSVSGAGDVNNDTVQDIIIGAPFARGVGAVYVLYGNRSTGDIKLNQLNPSQGFVLYGALKSDYFGVSVSGAGDVNKDGCDDIIVGAVATSAYYAGAAYIVYGCNVHSGSLIAQLTDEESVKFSGDAYMYAGFSVSGAGDMNSDGYDDVIIGSSPTVSSIPLSSFLIYGSQSLSTSVLTRLTSSQGVRFVGGGTIVSIANDFNGDSVNDVIMGSEIGSSSTGMIVYLAPGDNSRIILVPTIAPSVKPTRIPTVGTTRKPSRQPTELPTVLPTLLDVSEAPSELTTTAPTQTPSLEPTEAPTTAPTAEPSEPSTEAPTQVPISMPPIERSTLFPITLTPTIGKTRPPYQSPTLAPTEVIPAVQFVIEDRSARYDDSQSIVDTVYYIKATGVVEIDPSLGRCTYVIVPGRNLTVVIARFNVSIDLIDLRLFIELHEFAQLDITSGSVIITLPTNQVIHIMDQEPAAMRESNFLFIEEENPGTDVTFIILTVVAVVIPMSVLFGIGFYFYRLYETKERFKRIITPSKFIGKYLTDKFGEYILFEDGDEIESDESEVESDRVSYVDSEVNSHSSDAETIIEEGKIEERKETHSDSESIIVSEETIVSYSVNLSEHSIDSNGDWIIRDVTKRSNVTQVEQLSDEQESESLSDRSVDSNGDW